MTPFFTEQFSNPSSPYESGKKVRTAVENAREEVAQLIGAEGREICFTSGATESNNLALMGAFSAYREKGNEIITATTEHKAVLDTLKALEDAGAKVMYLPVDKYGQVSPDEVRKAITRKTILVSIMFANNEIGTIQPIKEIGKVTKEKNVLFHSDAAQAVGKIPVDVNQCEIDLLSISAHKIYGPKGIGALYVRGKNPRVRLSPFIHGGGHERGLRSGTLNAPGIVGLGAAAAIAIENMKEEGERIGKLRDHLQETIFSKTKNAYVNGHPTNRLPNNLSISFDDVARESFLSCFEGIEVSSGSACSSANVEPSHVLKAIGLADARALGTLRFGLGRFTTQEEIDFAAKRVIETIATLRSHSPFWKNGERIGT